MNPWHALKEEIAKEMSVNINEIEEPSKEGFGDFAYPCFNLAKEEKQNPNKIAEKIAKNFKLKYIKETKSIGPYVNFYINWAEFAEKILFTIDEGYGSSDVGKGKTVI